MDFLNDLVNDPGFLGFVNELEENEQLLDDVIFQMQYGNHTDFRSACLAANVDPNSITKDDMIYIKNKMGL